MPAPRPFRFAAVQSTAASAADWAEVARRVEGLGYDTLVMADHPPGRQLAPLSAMLAAALATTTLRVGCTVFDNDFRHPVMLAKEAATVDVLSGGRLEFGLGAGWKKSEYDQMGLPYDPPGVRVSRMEEALAIVKGFWGDGAFSMSGRYYTIRELEGLPKPVQRPHPPIFVGGGGRRLLSFAAREADVVGITSKALPGGEDIDHPSDTEELLAEKVGWIREAAGERFAEIELAALMWGAEVTDDRGPAVERFAARRSLTAEQVLASPYFLMGSVDAIVERLLEIRERFSISYISVFPPDMEGFAPVVARLAGE